jgi:hypothetical protein
MKTSASRRKRRAKAACQDLILYSKLLPDVPDCGLRVNLSGCRGYLQVFVTVPEVQLATSQVQPCIFLACIQLAFNVPSLGGFDFVLPIISRNVSFFLLSIITMFSFRVILWPRPPPCLSNQDVRALFYPRGTPSLVSNTRHRLSDEERDSRTPTAVAKIADTVALLLQCPLPPPGEGIGPVGGGCIQHGFFCMQEAPIPFVNLAALEKYVNKVRFHVSRPHTVCLKLNS